MDITALIQHPENMNKTTLYDLRSLLALYPTYQAARLLLLQNLYLLHDPTFDEELRRAAIYISDRKRIFQLIEAPHYQLRTTDNKATDDKAHRPDEDRTTMLIDNFLDSLPEEEEDEKPKQKRKPTPADAAVDYVAYLLETESEKENQPTPQLKGQNLIDNFLSSDDANGRIQLSEEPELEPELDNTDEEKTEDSDYFTETLAKIYIKQGRYSKALEIIKRLYLINPKKNRYFADQIRFLQKLIINNK